MAQSEALGDICLVGFGDTHQALEYWSLLVSMSADSTETSFFDE
jgi:hypothetical protein